MGRPFVSQWVAPLGAALTLEGLEPTVDDDMTASDLTSPIDDDLRVTDEVLTDDLIVEGGTVELDDVLLAESLQRVELRGGTLRVGRAGTWAVFEVFGGTLELDTVEFRGKACVIAHAGQVRVFGCNFEASAETAIAAVGPSQVAVEECLFTVLGTAILAKDSAGLEVRECTFEDCEVAISLATTQATWIERNAFHGVGTAVTTSTPGPRAQVASNKFSACSIGVYVGGHATPDIVGNEFQELVRACVETHGYARPYIEGNLFQKTTEFALRAHNRSKPHIALNAFKNNGGRLHMDARAYPDRSAPIKEWSKSVPFTPSAHTSGTPPVLVPRQPQSESLRQRRVGQVRSLVGLVGFVTGVWILPFMIGAGHALFWMLGALAIAVATVTAASIHRNLEGRLLGRGWIARGHVEQKRLSMAQVRYTDHNAVEHIAWTWLPGARVGHPADVLYNPARPDQFAAIHGGNVRFSRPAPITDNRRLLHAPAEGLGEGDLDLELWDGPTSLATALQKRSGGVLERLRRYRAELRSRSKPRSLGHVSLDTHILRVGTATFDLSRPFTLSATTWPMNSAQTEVYLQISGVAPEEGGRQTAGVRSLVSQARVSAEVPEQQRLWPWLEPADFDALYGRLVWFCRVHGHVPPAIALSDDAD